VVIVAGQNSRLWWQATYTCTNTRHSTEETGSELYPVFVIQYKSSGPMTETMSATLVQLHSCVVAPGECVCELKANYSDNIEW